MVRTQKNSSINLSDTDIVFTPAPPRLRGGILACAEGENDIPYFQRGGAHLDKEGQGVGLRIFALPDIEYQLSGTLR